MSTEVKTQEQPKSSDALVKSIDTLIEEIFAEEGSGEVVEKASDAVHAIIGEPKKAKEEKDPNKNSPTKADDNGAEEEGEEDEKAGKKRGRPEDLAAQAKRKPDGASNGNYDADITEPAKAPEMKKAIEVTPEDFEVLQKAKKAQEEEALRKAKEEQENLFKAAVDKATEGIRKENEELRKSLTNVETLLKSMAKKPAPRKSISSVQVLEKSFAGEGHEGSNNTTITKAEMLDEAEKLVKSGDLRVEDVIELEDTGFIYDAAKRAKLERALHKRS